MQHLQVFEDAGGDADARRAQGGADEEVDVDRLVRQQPQARQVPETEGRDDANDGHEEARDSDPHHVAEIRLETDHEEQDDDADTTEDVDRAGELGVAEQPPGLVHLEEGRDRLGLTAERDFERGAGIDARHDRVDGLEYRAPLAHDGEQVVAHEEGDIAERHAGEELTQHSGLAESVEEVTADLCSRQDDDQPEQDWSHRVAVASAMSARSVVVGVAVGVAVGVVVGVDVGVVVGVCRLIGGDRVCRLRLGAGRQKTGVGE